MLCMRWATSSTKKIVCERKKIGKLAGVLDQDLTAPRLVQHVDLLLRIFSSSSLYENGPSYSFIRNRDHRRKCLISRLLIRYSDNEHSAVQFFPPTLIPLPTDFIPIHSQTVGLGSISSMSISSDLLKNRTRFNRK